MLALVGRFLHMSPATKFNPKSIINAKPTQQCFHHILISSLPTLPLSLIPLTSKLLHAETQSLSFLHTWQYHRSRLLLTTSVMHSMPSRLLNSALVGTTTRPPCEVLDQLVSSSLFSFAAYFPCNCLTGIDSLIHNTWRLLPNLYWYNTYACHYLTSIDTTSVRHYLTCIDTSLKAVAEDCRPSSNTHISAYSALVHPASTPLAHRAVSKTTTAACCSTGPVVVATRLQQNWSICSRGSNAGPNWKTNYIYI